MKFTEAEYGIHSHYACAGTQQNVLMWLFMNDKLHSAALAGNPNTPTDILEKIATNGNSQTLRKIAFQHLYFYRQNKRDLGFPPFMETIEKNANNPYILPDYYEMDI